MSDVKFVTITMKETESVATSRGPVVYKRGETYEVEDWIASSLIGRDRAVLASQNASQPSPEAMVFDLESLPKLNIGELRDLAQRFQIESWESMKKEPLKKAITDYVLRVRSENKQPVSSFEPVSMTGGKQPPEFTQA